MIKGWGCRGAADTEPLEEEQSVHQRQLPPAFAGVGRAVLGCCVCGARQDRSPVALLCRDGEGLFLTFSDCHLVSLDFTLTC